MVRIAITAEAFDAICAALPLGSVRFEAKRTGKGRTADLDRGCRPQIIEKCRWLA
jgi:hypothetical protein